MDKNHFKSELTALTLKAVIVVFIVSFGKTIHAQRKTSNEVKPFKISISSMAIIDLKKRIAETRWSDEVNVNATGRHFGEWKEPEIVASDIIAFKRGLK